MPRILRQAPRRPRLFSRCVLVAALLLSGCESLEQSLGTPKGPAFEGNKAGEADFGNTRCGRIRSRLENDPTRTLSSVNQVARVPIG